MKHQIFSILSLLLACAMLCVVFTGCVSKIGGSDGPQSGSPSESDAKELDEQIEQAIAESAEQLDPIKQAVASLGMEMNIFAREGSLVYSYRFTTEYDKDALSVMKTTLDAELAKNDSTFLLSLSQMRTAVPDLVSLVVEYLNKDGTVITSKAYTGEPSKTSSGE